MFLILSQPFLGKKNSLFFSSLLSQPRGSSRMKTEYFFSSLSRLPLYVYVKASSEGQGLHASYRHCMGLTCIDIQSSHSDFSLSSVQKLHFLSV